MAKPRGRTLEGSVVIDGIGGIAVGHRRPVCGGPRRGSTHDAVPNLTLVLEQDSNRIRVLVIPSTKNPAVEASDQRYC